MPVPPGVMNAELFARAPDNLALLLAMLEDEPVSEQAACATAAAAANMVP